MAKNRIVKEPIKPRSDWRAISLKSGACVSFFNGCCTHFAACVPSKNKKLTPNARQSERSFKRLGQFRVKEEIFTKRLKYSDTHVRKIVTVMDEDRI